MLNIKPFIWRLSAGSVMLLAACVVVVRANAPRGWHLAGSNPQGFEVGVDANQTYQNHASAFLRSTQSRVEGFGTLMQSVRQSNTKAKKYALADR